MRRTQHTLRLVILCGLLACGTIHLWAQENCLVRYNYDAAGNRIKRYWYCLGHDEIKSMEHTDGLSQNGLTLFPVPATTTMLTVRLDSAVVNATLEVSDAQGRVLLTERMSGATYELTVTDLSNGIYHLRVIKDREYFLSSFTVEH